MKIILSLLFFSLSFSVFAQTITGSIKDTKGIPIEGAYIVTNNDKNHLHSNAKGVFQLQNISVGDILFISHVGYKNQNVVIQNTEEKIDIVLTSKTFTIEEVVVASETNPLQLFTKIDIQLNPVNSSQDVLQKVPGLFIGQHAGGGKAEQIFLRGFDIDHGTDISITVDDMPVNMVSHAHGQGYADLHFVIPETIEKINFGKGSYNASKGNFATAGHVNFKSKEKLDESIVKLESGQFNSSRILGMFNLLNSTKNNAYIATEFIATDGPFESPQNFKRTNLIGKYTGYTNKNDRFSFTTSHFTSSWDASGQIPQRAVDDGSITRFGAIDDTEGGTTSRTNFIFDYLKYLENDASIKNTIYYSKYKFELYSNFTFFLNDPINGDQIRQKESRDLFGIQSEYNKNFYTDNINGNWQIGLQLRNDKSVNNELSHTANRSETITQMKFGDINETNFGAYANLSLEYGKWTFNPSIRIDHFSFMYHDALASMYTNESQTKSIVSPKLNFIFNATEKTQLYLKTGKGFHSNDTRVVIEQSGEKILPASYSADLGFLWKPNSKSLINIAYWNLFLEQEFVYVGDEGIVEPSGKTNRNGIDFSFRYQPMDWLIWNLDANYTHARSIEEETGNDYIPLAPDFTIVSGINFEHPSGIYGGLNVRFIDDRPANEDNTINALGYTVADLNAGYRIGKIDIGFQIQNLFNVDWNETQFATASRLQNETNPVEEIHFTPGTPFFLKGNISYTF